MSSYQASEEMRKKKGRGNPSPKRGQIKIKMMKDILSFFIGSSQQEEAKQDSREDSASASDLIKGTSPT
ncbi:hypothetical protein KFK09_016894 [Dendrobium nobile]|uniref:Uncharacterized protein n=1 Tax=Dendrobium nobile TaxID=94219 RepID=A0A8T3AZY3_DENNO|nr:hypothetical protein KFK09_016894 [Dendrobium nobile]